MPTVFVPAQLRDLTSGQDRLRVDAASLGDVIHELDRQFPGVKQRLCAGGELSPGLQASIGQELTRNMATRVPPDSEVHFLPALGGG